MTVERPEPPLVADERTMLESWLDYHRATLAFKCDGVAPERLAERTVPPSTMSLLGLVRHMADVERIWFRWVLAGEDATPIYWAKDDPEADWEGAATADPEEDFATWRAECDRAREIVAGMGLDDVGRRQRRGQDHSVRWVLVHMVEEYARHNGHADLLRERLDGAVGD